MGSANKVPFCFSGYDALDIRWVVLIPGLTGLAITSHRPRNFSAPLFRPALIYIANTGMC